MDIEHLKQWVGRERTVVDGLPEGPARALAATLDRSSAPIEGDALPPGWQWLYFTDTPMASELGEDGHPRLGGFLPPVPLPRRMWAAGSARMERPLRIGSPARRLSRVQSVEAKSGRSGALVFVTLEHVYLQDGERCLIEEQDLVYREMPGAARSQPPGVPGAAAVDWESTVVPDPVLLFRYSALTFNGHRIHYDRPYAVEKEGYRGLVVQSPLLATLLLELVHRNMPDVQVRSFRFRALRPTFDTHPFVLRARRDGSKLVLWSADSDDFTCVSAEAETA